CVNRSSLSKASYPTCTKHVKKTTAHRWVGQEDIRNSLGRLNDPGKPPLRRLGILPRQLRVSPLFLPGLPGEVRRGQAGQRLRRPAWRQRDANAAAACL